MRRLLLFICLLLPVAMYAQPKTQQQTQYTMTKEELLAKRKELLDDINETEKQLEAIKNDKKATMSQLRALQNKLALRQNLIANINDDITDIDRTIRSSAKEVDNLKQKLEQLKVRYAQSIRYAYETRSSYDMLAFLFSSRDFNDAMRRMKYLKKFREFRRQQVDQIHNTQSELKHKIVELNDEKAEKDKLRTTEEQQKQELIKETNNTNKVIEDLKGQESQLLKNIEKNRVVAKRVNNAIQVVIEREMAKAAKAAEEEEKKRLAEANKAPATPAVAPEKPKPGTPEPVAANNPPSAVPRPRAPRAEAPELFLTPTAIALANNFEGNRGKLYWPVEKGYITDHYGVHPHPIERKVMIKNDGIDIQTSPNANVKAVFEGKVSSVLDMAGVKMVMLIHGNYFTVYNNLVSTSVSIGQQVSTNQILGVVANNEEGEPTIKFQIWKSNGTKKGILSLNPEQWLGKAR